MVIVIWVSGYHGYIEDNNNLDTLSKADITENPIGFLYEHSSAERQTQMVLQDRYAFPKVRWVNELTRYKTDLWDDMDIYL